MPLLLLGLLRKFWPYLLALAALWFVIAWASHARYQAGYDAAQAHMAEAVRKAEAATRAAEAQSRAITEAKDREWQTEREDLQGRITGLLSRPAPAIRLCKSAGRGDVPAVPAAASEPDAGAARGESTVQAGEDLRPGLVVYGGDCERTRRQLSALQGWVAAQSR